jgi:soluble lytic murein transglycosylase
MVNNLKRRWKNFSTASRLLVVSALLGIIVFGGLVAYLWQGEVKTGTLPALGSTSPTATPLPTPISFNFAPAPEATPSQPPKDEPARLLVLANRYLADGEPVDATAQYKLILSNYPKSQEAADAAFGLAQASADRQRWQETIDLYKKFLTDYPNDSRRALAFFALGDAEKNLGYWDEAISYYQKYTQEKDKPLEGYAWFEIGTALDNTLRKDQAIDAYKKAGSSPNGSNQLRANSLEKVGDYYAAAGNSGAAADWYNKVLDVAKIPDYRAGILLKMARSYAGQKQTGQATTLYNIIVDQYLETPSGLTALKALNSLNPNATSDFHRGYLAYQSSDWDGAIDAFSKMLGRTDLNAPPNATPALPANLSKTDQERLAKAWFWLGRAYEQKGDPTRAANEYRELQIRLPQTEMAQEAIWRVAIIIRNAGQGEAAATQFGFVAAAYPAGRYAETALYNQADLIMKIGGPDAALPLVNAFADKYPASGLRNEIAFTLYEALQSKGNKDAARNLLQKVATSTNDDYFAIHAAELMSGQNPMNAPRSNPVSHPAVYDPVQFAKQSEKDRKTMEDWLLTWAAPAAKSGTTPTTNATPGSALTTAQQNIQNDAQLRRIAELRKLDRLTQAEREATEAIDRYGQKPLELYLTTLYLNQQGDYYNSLLAAKDLLALYRAQKPGAGLRATPLLMQKLIYPLDYQNLVLEYSKRNDLDPLLFLALMRQESAFKSTAVSSVGARGLTQVMPDTGRAIAANLDKPDFNVDDLFRPALGIEFGTYYLGRRLQDFDGNPYAALSAYNGGAGNVPRWLKGIDPQNIDSFIDNIDYPETRQYVEIVYTNYAMYRQIYAASAS